MKRILLAGGPSDIARELTPKLARLGLEVVDHWDCERSAGATSQRGLPQHCEGIVIIRAPNRHYIHDRAKELAKAAAIPWCVTESKIALMRADLMRCGLLGLGAAEKKLNGHEPRLVLPIRKPMAHAYYLVTPPFVPAPSVEELTSPREEESPIMAFDETGPQPPLQPTNDEYSFLANRRERRKLISVIKEAATALFAEHGAATIVIDEKEVRVSYPETDEVPL